MSTDTLWPVEVEEDPFYGVWDARSERSKANTLWRVEDDGTEAWLTNGTSRVPWLRPLPHQEETYFSPARNKLNRCGRRWGKSRVLWLSCMEGHGPDVQRDGRWEPLHRGVLHGFDVVWLARDQKQARALWDEEVEPFFREVKGVSVNATERFVILHGTPGERGIGTLYVRSNENIHSVRGIGKYLIGVAADEVAHFALRLALDRVIGPALVDNFGWFIGCSTTNGGRDGDHERPEGPSWFNTLCEKVRQSDAARSQCMPEDADLADDWAEFHGTTRDNKNLPPEAVEAEYARLKHDPNAIAEELDAKLGIKPSGVAFPEWRDDLILTHKDWAPPAYWGCEAGFDWGYSAPGWFGIAHFGPERKVHFSHELLFNGHGAGGWKAPNSTPFEIGQACARLLQASGQTVSRIVADIPDTHKDGRGGLVTESIQEEFERGMRVVMGKAMPMVLRQKKGDKSRAARKLLMHELLRYDALPDGTVKPWSLPQLSVNPRCIAVVATMTSIPLDPVNRDDVDTDSVFDHCYDGLSGLALAKRSVVEAPAKPVDLDTYVIKRPKPVQQDLTYTWGE